MGKQRVPKSNLMLKDQESFESAKYCMFSKTKFASKHVETLISKHWQHDLSEKEERNSEGGKSRRELHSFSLHDM